MAVIIIASVAAPLCLVVVVLGCLNCFMKRKPGFSPFSNPNFVEDAGRHNDAFAVDMEPTRTTPTNESHIVIEPLPDIMAEAISLPPLRPKMLCVDKENESSALSFGSHRSFPRENLTYLNPLGVGWFGQTIVTEALRMSTDSMRSQVVVKMLKDEASKLEEKQFIEEIMPYRYLDHQNVMALLGQCTETSPFLVIVEYAPNDNLKTFLQSHKQSLDTLMKKNKLLQFCLDAAAGLACIHRHNFVHCDLAARNCLVMTDLTIKIGDYGISEQLFKEDYFPTSTELLPIRWMAPECLVLDEGSAWSSQNYSKASDMWSFGVLLWEVFSMMERPYDMLTDEAVLQGVVLDRVVSLAEIPLRVPFHDRLSALVNECCTDPEKRMTIEAVHQVLGDMSKEKVERVSDELDFEQKWNHLIPNSQSRSQSLISEDGSMISAIALAGSFSSETPFSSDDKRQSFASLSLGDDTKEMLDESNVEFSLSTPVVASEVPNTEKPINDSSNVPSLPEQAKGKTVAAGAQSSVSEVATPVKSNEINPSQHMVTSTPLVNRNAPDKTSSSTFLTALNTPSSQYITAQESFSIDSVKNTSQDISADDFGSFSSAENTIQDSETDKQESTTNNDFKSGIDSDKQNINLGKDESEEWSFESAETEAIKKIDQKALSTTENVLDLQGEGKDTDKSPDLGPWVSAETSVGSSDTKQTGAKDNKTTPIPNVGGESGSANHDIGPWVSADDPNKSQELDTSFDVLMPSMLTQGENSVKDSQTQNTGNSLLNIPEDSDNDVQITSQSPVEVGTSLDILNSNSIPSEKLQLGTETSESVAPVTLDLQLSSPNISVDKSKVESDLLSPSDPFTSNDPFPLDMTTSTSSQDAVIVNKTELDASSSLNSSLVGWDSTKEMDDSNNSFVQMNQSSDSFSFLENNGSNEGTHDKSSLASSDFSLVDAPVVSDDLPSDNVPESTGNDPSPVSDSQSPSILPNQVDDPFGLSSPTGQPSQVDDPFGLSAPAAQPTSQVDDPFGLSAPAAQPTSQVDDPFGLSAPTIEATSPNDDPFGLSAPATQQNPFLEASTQPITASSPQITSFSSTDPFDFSSFESKTSHPIAEETEKNITASSDIQGLDLLSGTSASPQLTQDADFVVSVSSGDKQTTSSDVNVAPSSSMDLLGLEFDSAPTSSSNESTTEPSSSNDGNPQESNKPTTDNPSDFSLI